MSSGDPTKICHVIVGLEPGGAERTLQRLVASHSRDHRFQHSIVSLTKLGPVGAAIRESGIDVVALGTRALSEAPLTIWRLRGEIQKRDPDIVQCWMYHGDLVGGLAARLAGKTRVIWGIHTTDMMRGTARPTALVRRLCALLSSTVPWVIVCVAEAAREAHAAIGYDRARMVVIPNGFDLDALRRSEQGRRALRAELGFTESTIVVGCVARYNYYKDYGNLVRAAARVCRSFPDARFLLVGGGVDRGNRELVALLDETRCAGQFTLLGARDDIVDCLSAMDIFCLPSRSEAFPIAVGEAMCVGLPCVVTNVGDSAVLVGDCGVVVPKENPDLLAAALLKLLRMTPAERTAMGAGARERVATRFSMALTRRRFEDLYLAAKDRQADGATN